MKVWINWTQDKQILVCAAIEKWIIKHGAHSGEMIMQDDECQITASELLSDIVDDIIQPQTEYDENE